MILAALPPLITEEPRPSWLERFVYWGLVVGGHLALLYGALYFSVRNDLIRLPPSIEARLLPMVEEKPPEPIPLPPTPPPPRPAPKKPPKPLPVLTAATPVEAPAAFTVAPQPPAPPEPVALQPAPPAPIVPPSFGANYLHNPEPEYPMASRRGGEEGKVLLWVRVSARGEPLEVKVRESSGFWRLDKAARDVVTRWRFVPASQGGEPIESSVRVPINFVLK